MMELDLDRLVRAAKEDAAIRTVRRLQPAGGPGDKIFPPTYPGDRTNDPPRHVFERRRIDGQNVLCVLIDSVQSQANRLEEALRTVREAGELAFPVIAVDFSNTPLDDIGRITTLDAPHRVFDAIIRDSELNGKRFRDTEFGKQLVAAKIHNARALFELSPSALVFGAWNSTGEGGGLGAKFPRAVVSEIIGVGVAVEADSRTGQEKPSGHRTGSRIDPLGIRSGIRIYKLPNGDWSLEASKPTRELKEKDVKKDSKAPKEVKPSEVNHSNIRPTVTPLGVSVDYALHSFVLSLAALRRLRFTTHSGGASDTDNAARAALAALGLAAALAQDRGGYFLRSRCDLVREAGQPDAFEIVRPNGAVEEVALSFSGACALVRTALDTATQKGLTWRRDDVVLKPQPKLVELVTQSRELALEGLTEGEE
jgi:CRISPR-associated protein Csb1